MRGNWPNQIVMVRHGQSVRNAAKATTMVFYDIKEPVSDARGIPDHRIPLTELGVLQAKSAGRGLAIHYPDIDVSFDSGYLRTEDTRKHALEAYPESVRRKIRIIQDVTLRERVAGWGYDMFSSEADQAFPWLPEYWKLFGPFFACPPGGESIAEAVDRASIFLMRLRMDFAGKNVFISAHGRKVACMRFLLENWTWQQGEDFVQIKNPDRPKNCGVTTYEYSETEDRMVLKEYNTVYDSGLSTKE